MRRNLPAPPPPGVRAFNRFFLRHFPSRNQMLKKTEKSLAVSPVSNKGITRISGNSSVLETLFLRTLHPFSFGGSST